MKAARTSLIAMVVVALAVNAQAALKDWGDGTGNWSDGANWNPTGVPAAGDTVNISFSDDVARTVTYDYIGPAIALGPLTVDMTGAGTNATTLSMAANVLTTAGESIGPSGRGIFEQSGGVHTVAGGNFVISATSTGAGSYGLSGTGQLIVPAQETVGDAGTGLFAQVAGSNTTSALTIGAAASGLGTYSLGGGSLNVTGGVSVGSSATGNGSQSGGTFTQTGGTHNVAALTLGNNAGATGTYTLSGGTLVSSLSELIGDSGTGTFSQSSGAHASLGNISIGASAGSTGNYSLNGGTASAPNIYVGGRSSGAGGTGAMSVNGTSTTLTVPGTITVYNTPESVFNLSGGTLNVGAINVNGAPSLFNWTGGTLNITNDVAWDSAAGINSTGAAFGSSLSVSSSKILKVAGNETIGGTGTFNLSLGGNSSGAAAHVVTGNITLKPGGSILANGGYLQCANLIQAGGSITGQYRNLSNFTYQSGNFAATLINNGTVTFGSTLSVFTLQNEASMTISAGQLLSTLSSGITNSGTFTVNAGSISTSNFTNTGNTTFNAGGFTSSSTSITNSGSFVMNGGNIPSGNVTNSGTFVLNGGTISASTFTNSVSGNMTAHGSFGGQLVNHGTLTVDGAFTFTNSNTVTQDGIVQGVGTISNSSGSASFNNSTGGVINSTTPNGTLVINNLSTNNAGAVVNVGPTSTLSLASFNGTGGWTNSGTVYMQGPGARLTGGAMTLQNGGIIQGAGLVTSSLGTSNNGVIRASGGELAFTAAGILNSTQSQIQMLAGSTANFMQGISMNSGVISLVGGTFENNSRTMTNAGTINGYGTLRTGGLTNNSGRLLSVGSGNMDVFGNVTNNGTVSIQNGRTATFYGNVNGSGSFTGTGTAVFLGSLSPGSSPALVNFGGNANLGGAISLSIELGGSILGTTYDKIHVTGELSIGGTLAVSLINGFLPGAGATFDVLDWGTLSGTFSTLQLPTLPDSYTWDTSQLYTTGVLSVTSGGVPGDYNSNGVVDGADYTLWRKGGPLANEADTPGVVDDADYTQWRVRFGNTSGSGLGGGAVPEPAGAILLLCGMLGAAVFRRR